MRYLPYVGLTILVVVSGAYALKARSIRDYLVDWMAKKYGSESMTYRLSKSFMGNSFYLCGKCEYRLWHCRNLLFGCVGLSAGHYIGIGHGVLNLFASTAPASCF